MLYSTPEFVAAHLQDLADKPPKAGPEAIARYRRERRQRRLRSVVAIVGAIPLLKRAGEARVASGESKPVT